VQGSIADGAEELLNPADEDRGIREYLRSQPINPATFNTRISPKDEMFLFTLESTNGNRHVSYLDYFTAGRRNLDWVRQVVEWYFGGFGNVSRYLDFASGYGRGVRYLSQAMPPERIWACDIYAAAMAFQRRWHGVNAGVSVTDPDRFPPEELASGPGFDCITAVSFFTHMPQRTFARWLAKLYGLVAPGGMMAFSVHDMSLVAGIPGYDATADFLFFPRSESKTLDGEEYGGTYISERELMGIIREVLPPQVAVHRIPRGINFHQDIYIIANDPARDPSVLDFQHHPQGWLEGFALQPTDDLLVHGWAADPNPGGRVEEVQVIVDGRIVQRCRTNVHRPDVAAKIGPWAKHSGFGCRLEGGRYDLDDVMLVRAVSSRGLELVLYCDTPATWLARPSQAIAKRSGP
jgi:SAM-dependent methyltransferase